MSQPFMPGWAAEMVAAEQEAPKRTFRFSQADVSESRKRGTRRGAASRHALKALPPIDPDNPEDYG